MRGAGTAGWRRSTAGIAVVLAVSGAPAGTAAQADTAPAADTAVPSWLFPARELIPELLAGSRDPAVRGQLVYAWDDPTRYGPGVSGEVAVGATLPLVRLAGSTSADALVVGLEGAAFARFSFEVVERELVNTDWVFAVPVVWHRGEHWLRLRYYHTSSHLGDEYARRYEERGLNFSRDALDATAYLRASPALGVYALLRWAANVHPEDAERWVARGGVELDPWRGRLWRPYLAADVRLDQDADWDPRLTTQVGLWLPAIQGRPFRLALEVLAGPTPMGQFHGRTARQVALGLVWNP